MTNTPTSPEQRAWQAAEEVAAQGRRVTARAIREAAGVSMTVAAAVARGWNKQQGPEDVPPVPEAVQLRLAGVWREAVAAARTEHDAARQGWEAQLAETQDEARELETALEAAETQVEQLHREVEDLQTQVQGQRSRADRAEAQDDQLTALVAQLRTEIEQLRDQVQVQRSRADRAEALLEQFQRQDDHSTRRGS